MKLTLISHFYNEEYLLPWWLEHHKKMFDHGIMIDYASTDNSVAIIKDICPNWEVRQSRNEFFDALKVDAEVEDIEREIDGWRICLNTTEFLLGNLSIIETYDEQKTSFTSLDSITHVTSPVTFGFGIPSIAMIDSNPEILPTYDIPLIDQKTFGIHYRNEKGLIRPGRLLHDKKDIKYSSVGRHYHYTTEELVILWYCWSPFNKKMIDRKLQIQNRVPEDNKILGLGAHHFVSLNEVNNNYKEHLSIARELKEDINKYKNHNK